LSTFAGLGETPKDSAVALAVASACIILTVTVCLDVNFLSSLISAALRVWLGGGVG
jgi:hypothetical protein